MTAKPDPDPSRKPAEVSLLAESKTPIPASPSEAVLESFSNTHPGRDYLITFDCPEFTALCPITGQPDFGKISIEYVPDQFCIESKSLKIYLFSYRNHGSFHEEVVNLILDDIVQACRPRRATVKGDFLPRGGIAIKVSASYSADTD